MEKTWLDGPAVTADLLTHVMTARGLTPDSAFLNPTWPDQMHDPFLLPDMDKAVARLWQAISNQEGIGIVGDYDMDGTPAAVLLHDWLRQFAAHVEVILPTRADGYGFATEFVDRLKPKNVSLIITVDCGIRDHAAVMHAKTLGIDVVITDHHECPETLPDALAVINPKRADSHYPFRELCGTGVAFKLAQAMSLRLPPAFQDRYQPNWLAWSLDLVALSTIGDMVPLIDENRLFVIYGLKVLKRGHRPGLRRLFEALQLDAGSLSSGDIAFKIIPKLNASGRMESMDAVFTLLSERDIRQIDSAIAQVLARSTQSQLLLTAMTDEARKRIDHATTDAIIVIADAAWHPGLTGIVASRLAEEFKRPVGVFAEVEGSTYRGSMRSVPGVHLPQVLTPTEDLLDKFGGHEQAAGISLAKANFPVWQARLAQTDLSMIPRPIKQTMGTLEPDMVTLQAVDDLSQLMPWGMGNEEPLWSFRNVTLRDPRWLKDGAHLKALLPGTDQAIPAIYFGASHMKPYLDAPLDLYGTLSVNEFRGKREPQLVIRGALPLASEANANELVSTLQSAGSM